MKIYFLLFYFIIFHLKSDDDINYQEKLVIATINKTMKNLKNKLQIALKDGDIVSALKICSVEAQDLTILNSTEKTSIKRISLKYRNPANKPTKQEALILKSFEEKLQSGTEFKDLVFKKTTTNYKEKTYIFIKAIPVKEVCLNCHGSNVSNKVLRQIKINYPDDKAIDFNIGEIRGAFSVRHIFN
ncbi:MAG: hypothetical protein CBC22_00245 [Alphaproteobacteria bacterium TMED62]|nr:MAG: hypothetical protein CBC22_00245 [Alphaproteobacteria bacterium TMED62]|tara:strand:- start:2852 stop:3409 length:558 start_codon:yes stop_codon:yes gene_type:complete